MNKKPLLLVLDLLFAGLLLAGCGRAATPTITATFTSPTMLAEEVLTPRPTASPTPTPDLVATGRARREATMQAQQIESSRGRATALALTPTPKPTELPPVPLTLPPVTGDVDLHLLGSAGGSFNGIALMDNIAVLSAGMLAATTRLEVLDLARPGAPRLLGRSELLPGVPAALMAVNRIVYATIPDSGLLVFDLSDPSRPVEIAQLELSFTPRAMKQQDGRLFVSGGFCQDRGCSGGLAVLDIADPGRPRLLGVLETPARTDRVELAGRNAYLYERKCLREDCKYSLRVVDVTDPTAPKVLAVMEVPGQLVNLVVDGDHLLLAHETGLLVIDVSQPDNPRQAGRLQFNYLRSFVVYHQVAYAVVTDGWGEWEIDIGVVDLSDLAQPRLGSALTQELWLGWIFSDAAIYGSTLYILSGGAAPGPRCSTGLHVFDLLNPAGPRQVNTEQDTLKFTCAGGPAIYGNRMVVSDWKGVHIVDLADPLRPRLQSSYPFTWRGYEDVAVQGGYIYASNGRPSDSDNLLVVDASEPAEPILHGPFPFSWARGIVPDGQYLYIPSYSGQEVIEVGLFVADISDPAMPREVARLGAGQLGGYAYQIALDGDRLVIDTGGDLRIVDISDAENPVPLGILKLPRGYPADGIAMHEGYIYLIADLWKDSDSRKLYLVVADARNPLKPLQVNQLDLPDGFRPAAMHFHEGRLLLAANLCREGSFGCSGRFSIYDLSDPLEPVEISALEFPFELKAMAEGDGLAYLSAAPDRVLALDLSDPASPALAALSQVPGCAGNLAAEGQRLYVAACEAGLLILGVERQVSEQNLMTHK